MWQRSAKSAKLCGYPAFALVADGFFLLRFLVEHKQVGQINGVDVLL